MSFYNIGAGSFNREHWTNIDFRSDHYTQIQTASFIEYDLTACAPLPITTGTAECIYSGHTIEHVPDDAVANLLREAHRALRPGGILRLTTPDADLIWRAYHNRDLLFFYELGKSARSGAQSAPEVFLDMFGSQLCQHNMAPSDKWGDGKIEEIVTTMALADALEHIARQCRFSPQYPYNHVNWFTPSKLERMLREAGFADVYRSGAGQSCAPEMRDLKAFDQHFGFTLYMEAVR